MKSIKPFMIIKMQKPYEAKFKMKPYRGFKPSGDSQPILERKPNGEGEPLLKRKSTLDL